MIDENKLISLLVGHSSIMTRQQQRYKKDHPEYLRLEGSLKEAGTIMKAIESGGLDANPYKTRQALEAARVELERLRNTSFAAHESSEKTKGIIAQIDEVLK